VVVLSFSIIFIQNLAMGGGAAAAAAKLPDDIFRGTRQAFSIPRGFSVDTDHVFGTAGTDKSPGSTSTTMLRNRPVQRRL
jgi:hypothetical protein